MRLKHTCNPEPTLSTSYTHPLHPTLPTFTPRILAYQDQLELFSSQLSTAQPVVNSLPVEHPRKTAHEHKMALLEFAKTRLESLVETTTKVVNAQLGKPNRALTMNTERANEEIKRQLVEAEEVLDELRYLAGLEEECW